MSKVVSMVANMKRLSCFAKWRPGQLFWPPPYGIPPLARLSVEKRGEVFGFSSSRRLAAGSEWENEKGGEGGVSVSGFDGTDS